MEGQSKEAIISRLKTLHNIQNQINGIIIQLTQLNDTIPNYDQKGKGKEKEKEI